MAKSIDTVLENTQLALIKIDSITLGIAQASVLSIENLSAIDNADNSDIKKLNKMSSGVLHYASGKLPIFTLNGQLKLLTKPSKNNRFCVAIKHPKSKDSFAIMCDAVSQYTITNKITVSKIPALNFNPDSPITGMIRKESKLVLIANAETMRHYINLQDQA